MALSTYFANAIIDHLLRNQSFTPPTAVYLSLHDGDPGSDGSNEVSGGSYARQQIALDTASNKATANTDAEGFTSMPVADIMAAGLWDAPTDGNFLIGGPLSGGEFTASASTDTFTAANHGMTNGSKIAFYGDSLPTGITGWSVYYVINADTNTFQISTTPGGSAVDLTTDGEGGFIKVKGTNEGDTFQIPAGGLDISFE